MFTAEYLLEWKPAYAGALVGKSMSKSIGGILAKQSMCVCMCACVGVHVGTQSKCMGISEVDNTGSSHTCINVWILSLVCRVK